MKPKVFLIALFLFLSFSSTQAQDSGWETGINVSGGGAWLNPKSGTTKNSFSWHYGAGIYGRKLFKPGVGVELGLQYGQYSTFAETDGYFGDMIDPIYGYNGPPAIINNQKHIRYAEVPVKFVFLKNKNKFGIGFNLGVTPAFAIHGKEIRKITGETAEAGTSSINNTKDLRTFNLFGETSLILRANIKPQFSLDFKPFFRGSLLSAYKFGSNYHPYTFGISINSVWRF
ncbi:MAG: outer membrane beta-barrel protein [Flavobacteriales bacterium]|nr:outer membrane beta-barrel protein [Flavobacteriales bacterium]